MTIAEVSRKYDITPDTLRYYERVGVIPTVQRTGGGVRNYTENDCGWVELAKCMRSSGLPIDCIIEYVKLSKEGDATIPQRRELLKNQLDALIEQRRLIDATIERLTYKVSRYDEAAVTGVLNWSKDGDKCVSADAKADEKTKKEA